MKTFEFTSPDGRKYEVTGPDSANQEQAFAVLQNQLKSSYKEHFRQTGQSIADVGAGMVKGAANVGRGLLSLPKLVGLPPIGGQEFIDRSRMAGKELTQGMGPAGKVAEFGTEVAMSALPASRAAMMLPKAGMLARPTATAAVEGGVGGALTGEGRWSDVGLGAGGGMAGNMLLRGAGRVLSQPVKQSPQAEELRRLGINVTAGQGSQGQSLTRSLEEATQYLPGTANAVRRQRELPYEQMRNIVAQQIQPPGAAPTGATMDDILRNARQSINEQYGNVLRGKVFREDPQFAMELTDVSLNPKWVLSQSQQRALAKFVNDQLAEGRAAGGWRGENLHIIRQNFEDAATRTSHPELSDAFKEVSDMILENMARQDPDVGRVFRELAGPVKNLRTAEEAARHAHAQGQFGVAQLAQAGVATGNEGMRDFGRLAATALKDDLNKGGQGLRTALGIAAIGAGFGTGYGYGGFPGAGAAAGIPASLLLALGTRRGQNVLAGNTQAQRQLAQLLRQFPDAGSVTGGVAAQNTFGDY